MRPKSLLLIVIALGCGLVASIGISQVLENRKNNPDAAAIETEPVYVALVDINHGEPLTADLVRLEEWPKGRVPEGAITNLDELIDRRPRSPLIAGEVILAGKLIDPNSHNGATDSIPKGMRVSSVVVATGDVPTGLVLPGDRVDVLCYFRASNEIPEATTRTILRNVTVFAVNEQMERQADQDNTVINAKTVALLMTPEQDRMVMLASELGKLRISLRRTGDEELDETDQITLSDLLDGGAQDATFEAQRDPVPAQDSFADFLNEQEEMPVTTAPSNFRMVIMTPDAASSYEWDESTPGGLPRPVTTPTAASANSGLPQNTPASDYDITQDDPHEHEFEFGEGEFEGEDFDYEQLQQMLEQGNLDIE